MDLSRPQRSIASSSTDHSTGAHHALNLSLGVEFEFLVLESTPEGQKVVSPLDRTMHISYGLSLISSVLEKAVPVGCLCCEGTHDVTLESHQQTPKESRSNHAVWNIVTDDTIKLDSRDQSRLRANKCNSYAVEVTSRVFLAEQKHQGARLEIPQSHDHIYTCKQEIAGVLNLLRSSFDTRQDAELDINKTCAFHVHIGNEASGFPLQTVKNVLCVYAAFERLIDGMHTNTRIGGSALATCALNSEELSLRADVVGQYPVAEDIYNTSLTDHLMSSAYVIRRNSKRNQEDKIEMKRYPANHMEDNEALSQAAQGFNATSFVEVIQQAPSLETLQQLFARTATNENEVQKKKTDINILNLSEPADPKRTNTIEFRQHAGVTTPEEALPWIDFVQTLVRYAHKKSAEEIKEVCASASESPHLTLEDFFGSLGVSSKTQQYYVNRNIKTTDNASPAGTEQSGTEDPMQSLVRRLAAQRKAESDPQAVTRAVRSKFRPGGYGQFSRDFVNEYVKDWSDEERSGLNVDSLVIGYQEPDEPEFEPFEEEKLDEERASEM